MAQVNVLTKPLSKEAVATKAFFKAAEILELNQKDISILLGPSTPTISRMVSKNQPIALDKKEGEIALIFLRVYRSLSSLFAGDEANMKAWFCAHNTYLNGIPKDLIKSIGGLIHVSEYLDALRGKI
jgi:hypothetical protein